MRSQNTFAVWRHAEDVRAGAGVWDRISKLPARWSAYVGMEYERLGGSYDDAARAWATKATEGIEGRVPLSASDEDIRAAAVTASDEARDICGSISLSQTFRHIGFTERVEKVQGRGVVVREWAPGHSIKSIGAGPSVGRAGGFGLGAATELLKNLCSRWGVEPPEIKCVADIWPSILRMVCKRWWLRRLRRAHGRRCDGAAIRAGVVRRGLWPYASQDAVERRGEQRRRNALALESATVECAATGESLNLAEVVQGSIANPEVKRSELMVRIKGCDAIAGQEGFACEFWTLTAPSRFHAHRIVAKKKTEPNPNFDGSTPKEAQGYISKVWARARAAWKRRGLGVYGLRTAEPHHDGCPHWHLICYGTARDLRFARRLLRVYALRESPDEPGARRHRFVYMKAKKGRYGAAYAAKYISKNINGEGMGKAGDGEAGRKVSDSVKRVDAWAATWGIRQFQFFGCPSISIWRTLRKIRGPVAVAGSMLERARAAADDSDFAGFWRAAVRGGLELVYRAADCLTAYGDAAAARIAGVVEGARRALLPVKDWVIHWKGKEAKNPGGLAFDLVFDSPRSCVNNCTRGGFWSGFDELPEIFSIGKDNSRLMSG